ncbi:MAG: dihydrofolate reductase [Puniceicoccales bacterium]|jgi:dihydrofolate reductase|nr:dihydrofolate reductase [Puniceicoccales bacterium]
MPSPQPIRNLRAIVAMDPTGTVGAGGQLPWHLPEDLRLFRSLTLGHTIVVGRRTFDSIGGPLPGRDCWLLTRRELPVQFRESVRIFSGLDSLLPAIREASTERQLWVIGGAEVYRQLVPYCAEIVQTALRKSYAGDVRWQVPENFSRREILLNTKEFVTYRWRRNGIAEVETDPL